MSGTSMAAPHVAGAAALLASGTNSPQNADDVQDIMYALVDTGNFNWIDDSGDYFHEPLLDLDLNRQEFSQFLPIVFVAGDGGGGTNNAPTASFTHDDCVVGQSCPFDGSSSYDSDGSIVAYDWDFDNDGLTDGTEVMLDYEFPISGTYPVTLTVTDNDGATDSDTQMVSVSSGGSGTPDACDGLEDGVHLTPSSTNQGRTWTALVDAVNCGSGNVANFDSVSLSWSPEVGTVNHDCSTSTGVCQASQSGIRKKTGSVQFTLNASTTMISKP
jgi:PKD repeat protein